MAAARLSDRKFGFMFVLVFLIVAAVGFFFFNTVLTTVLAIAGGLTLISLVIPWVLMPLNRFWMWFAYRFAVLNNYLILGVFYAFILIPFALVLKLIGRDPMHRKIGKDAESYWTPVTRHADATTFQDMF